MAIGQDQIVGMFLVVFSAVIFSYYTFWVLILPFVDAEHVVHQYFLPQMYAVTFPIIFGLIAVFGLGTFIGIVTLKNKMKEKES